MRYTPGDYALVLRDIQTDGDGFLVLSHDGVVRSYNGERQVIDYRNLDKQQIRSYLDSQDIDHGLEDLIQRAVDGRDVTNPRDLIEPTPDSSITSMTPDEITTAISKTSTDLKTRAAADSCDFECGSDAACAIVAIFGLKCGVRCGLVLSKGKRCY